MREPRHSSSLEERIKHYLPPGVEFVSLQGRHLSLLVRGQQSISPRLLLFRLEKTLRDNVDKRLEIY